MSIYTFIFQPVRIQICYLELFILEWIAIIAAKRQLCNHEDNTLLFIWYYNNARFVLDQRVELAFLVLTHWNNCPQVYTWHYLDTVSQFQAPILY
jgi:hypothetical protein